MDENEKRIEQELGEDNAIGLGIEPPTADEIDDLQSPPNSPGMVLSGIQSNTNEKIDFFVLDTTENSRFSNRARLSSQDEYDISNSMFTTPSDLTKRKGPSPISEKTEDVDLKLFSSSDSYFSRSRKIPEYNLKSQTKLKTRRASDVSDRSDGARSINSVGLSDIGSSGSYFSESDTDLTASPSAKYVKRRNMKKRDIDEASSDFSSFSDLPEDEGVNYGSLTKYAYSTSLKSNNRLKPSSRDRDDLKGKDGSATAQVFKNLLILEESLRQQYTQQQSMRYKYTSFLLLWALMFIVSTYFTSFNSIYETSRSTTEQAQVSVYQSSTSTCILESTLEYDNYCVSDKPTEMSKSDIEKSYSFDSGIDGLVVESGYVFKNIVNRIISIITGMTLVLFFITGEYTRTISRPRKFLTVANKGVRQLNIKLVKVKAPWRESIFRYISQFNFMAGKRGTQDIRMNGVDHIKLVLNPRVFSTATREQWELYRNQFWNLEEIRRLGQESSKSK